MKQETKQTLLLVVLGTLAGFVIAGVIVGILMLQTAKIILDAQVESQIPLFVSQCANGGSGDPVEDKMYCACVSSIASDESNGYKRQIPETRGYEIVDMCLEVIELRKSLPASVQDQQ